MCLAALAGCCGQAAKDAASTIEREAVEVGKGAVRGIEEGVAQGPKSAASPDDAIIVTHGTEMVAALKVEVLAVRTAPDRELAVEVEACPARRNRPAA